MQFVRTAVFCQFLCLLGFIHVQSSPDDSTEDIRCPSLWVRIHRGCYRFVTEEAQWGNALDHCKSHGGELTTIQSWKEKEELQTYMAANAEPTQQWWVGLKRNATATGHWKWIDNNIFDSNIIPWSNPSLKNRQGEFCGYVDMETAKLRFTISRCSGRYAFICEYHSITPRPVTDPTTPKPDEIVHTSTTSDTPTSTATAEETRSSGATSTLADPISDSSTASTPDLNTSPTMISTTELKATTTTSSTTEIPVVVTLSTKDTTTTPETTTEATTSTTDTTSTSTAKTTTAAVTTTTAATTTTTATTTTVSQTTVQPTTTQGRTSTASTTSTNPTQPVTSKPTTTRPTTPETTPSTRPTTTLSPRTTTGTSPRRTPLTTEPPRRIPEVRKPPTEDWAKAYEEFDSCHVPSTGGSLEVLVTEARRIYTKSRTSCPRVRVGNLEWDITGAGQIGKANCASGDGVATFRCDAEKVCWSGQPDITGCASQKLQKLLRQVEESPRQEGTAPPPTIEQSVDLSNQLVRATESEDTTVEDVIVASKVITTLTQVETTQAQDDNQVEAIVFNVVQTGSNFVSTNKSAMWESMTKEDKVQSASTLLVAMETATATMAEKIDKPTVIKKTDENIELELRVVDMNVLEKEKKTELVYDSSHSDSSFTIPIATLKSVSKGVLAKAVFMTHYSMSDLLGGRSQKRTTTRKYDPSLTAATDSNSTENVAIDVGVEDTKKDEDKQATGPQIVSYILSATLGVDTSVGKLPEPISFTMRHIEEIDDRRIRLCSFWNVSKQMQFGFWSQEGCKIVSTNKSHTTCSCDHMTNFAILLDVHGFEASKPHQTMLRLVTIIGCVISCVSLLASWITFQCFTSLQGERNSIHKNLAVTLLAAEIVFLFGIHQVQNQILCSVIAGFLHFLFLAAFMWMFIEGLHIIFMLVQVFDASRSRLPYYYLTGYGVPLAVVGASCLFYYKGYGTEKFCWLTTDRYFIWAFAGPVAMILLVNAFFLTYAMSTVCRHSDYVFSSKDKATGSGIRAWIQGALAIEVLLGLTWTLGYFLMNEDSLPLAYVFSALNSLQGLFIFVFHCLLNKKAQKEYRLMTYKVVTRTPSNATTHSTLTKRTNHTNSHDMNHSPSNSHQKLNITNRDSLA